ncbi:hypothetical protein ACP275_14G052000 [Erythranthe tilingii]
MSSCRKSPYNLNINNTNSWVKSQNLETFLKPSFPFFFSDDGVETNRQPPSASSQSSDMDAERTSPKEFRILGKGFAVDGAAANGGNRSNRIHQRRRYYLKFPSPDFNSWSAERGGGNGG